MRLLLSRSHLGRVSFSTALPIRSEFTSIHLVKLSGMSVTLSPSHEKMGWAKHLQNGCHPVNMKSFG